MSRRHGINKQCERCGTAFYVRPSYHARRFCAEPCRAATMRGSRAPRFRDLTGMKFGRLTVTGVAGRSARGKMQYACECECGAACAKEACALRNGDAKSCGCLHRKHGEGSNGAESLTYKSWAAMKRRCLVTTSSDYPRYGAVGITVCREWAESFVAFKRDMGARPSRRHSIDRIDGARGYEPGNCRWATAKEQAANRRKPRRRK